MIFLNHLSSWITIIIPHFSEYVLPNFIIRRFSSLWTKNYVQSVVGSLDRRVVIIFLPSNNKAISSKFYEALMPSSAIKNRKTVNQRTNERTNRNRTKKTEIFEPQRIMCNFPSSYFISIAQQTAPYTISHKKWQHHYLKFDGRTKENFLQEQQYQQRQQQQIEFISKYLAVLHSKFHIFDLTHKFLFAVFFG